MAKIDHKFTIVGDTKTGVTLFKDGNPVRCHKHMPFAIPKPLGGAEIKHVECNTQCGRANIYMGEKDTADAIIGLYYEQSCEGVCKQFALEEEPATEDENASVVGNEQSFIIAK